MKKTLPITQAAIIAALYVVLTHLANAVGLASGDIQIRISEALTVLPFFTPAAIPGLYVGCLIANITCGCAPLDVIFGSIATLLGAVGTYVIGILFRKKANLSKVQTLMWEIFLTIPPILANTIIVPFVLAYVYQIEGTIPFFMLTVGIGEVISCGILGIILLRVLRKNERHIFQQQ